MVARPHFVSLSGALAIAVGFAAFVLLPRHLAAQDCPTCPFFGVSVAPDGSYDPNRPKNSTGHTTTFTVTNTGNLTDTYNFSCSTSGGVTCTNVSPASQTLAGGAEQIVTVTYNVGASGGQITLDAVGEAVDSGYRLVTTPPVITLVIPKVTNGADTALVHTRTPLVLGTFTTADAGIDTTTFVLKLGSDTVTALSRRNAGLAEWEVDLAHQLAPGVAKVLFLKICNVNAGCASVTRQVVLDNSGPPIVSFTGMPLELHGHAPEVETGFAIPAYVSMGTNRSTGLVYSTRQSYPRALVNVDIELTWPAGNPDQIKAILRDGIVAMDSLTAATPTCQASTARRCRVTLQGDFSGSTYPRATRKWLNVEVRVTSGGTTKITVDSVEAVLVDRRSSPYGSGWFVSGVQRLDSAGSDMILVGSTGTATLFRGSGGQYLAPPGDTRVLVWTGSLWELRFPFSGCGPTTARLVFDGQGRQTAAFDCHAVGTSIAYVAVDRVSTITDPVSKQVTFFYNTTTVKLDSIRDPGGRRSKVTINGSNQLVYDSIASPGANSAIGTFSYTSYGGSNTVVLATQSDALGQATTFSYDARRRAYQTTLPAALPETGSTPVSAVISYRPQALRGLDSLLSADSIFAHARNPRGFWSRSITNRWGGALRTWDSLGTVMRATYSPEGRLMWAEGKVADSTRVYSTYDSLGRLLQSYRLRSASDTVLLDSLVYDASHRVTKRFNPLRQFASYTYNTAGDVLTAVTPTGDTTRYQWLTNGQLDRIKEPTQTGWTIYAYDATWKNVSQVTNAAGLVLTTNTYDTFGRVTEARRKLTVRIVGEPAIPDTMQWRRTRTWYNALNQVDSTRAERTQNCVAPCSSPTWPTDADTSNWQQVRHVFDRLGRDTARVNTRGKRTRYAYDGLGRLRRRWPFADSAAVVDSFRYDVAGNARFAWTRRGAVIEHRYDSRGRDTVTLVPGVGNYRQAFGGPSDQVTRAWIDSYTDPIGGVNPGVSWVYSQAGLLLSDTSQGNRVTTYQYDRYGRDTLVTDVRGTWRLRYDGVRGVLDSVVTPYGDTLRWTIDQRGRAVGPYISNGTNPDYAIIPAWDQVGKLVSLRDTHTVNVGRWQVDSTEPNLNLLPLWTEQQGSGGPTVTAQDTVGHDAWDRVVAVAHFKNGSPLASVSFTFDRDGNIRQGSETRTYDVATTRMTSRAGNSYYYDRAGNLDSAVVGGTGWRYIYDAFDRLIAVRQNGVTLARYAYDVLGRRVVKRVYSGANAGYLRMVYRGSAVAVEADSAGALTLGYTAALGVDNLVAIHRYADGSHYYVVQDALHSVRGLSRRDGTWMASWRYGIYGAVIDSAGSAPVAVRFRWTGREYDVESGFYYFRARYYDPAAQRFVQEDPIGFAGGANLYAYSDGNPTNTRDPSGLRATVGDAGISPATLELLGLLGCWDKVNCGGPWERYEGFLGGGGGGGGGFEFADLITPYEAHYTGNLALEGEALQVYYELRRQAYNASYAGNGLLLSLLAEASTISIVIQDSPICEPGCRMRFEKPDENFKLLYIGISITGSHDRGILPAVVLAHELGHYLAEERRPDLMGTIPGGDGASAFGAIYFENAARSAYGCMARQYNYNVNAPSC
jgi:RHS repeat-associated protein